MATRWCGSMASVLQTLRVRVDDVTIRARETDERHARLRCQINGQCGRCRHGDDQGYADGGRLLYHLVARTAGDDEIALARVCAGPSERADDLVQCVVPSHVFAHQLNALTGHAPGRRVP